MNPLRRHWKVLLVLGIIVTPAALATTGHLDDITDAGGDVAADVDAALDDDLNHTQVEILVHDRINEIRDERGLTQLEHDTELRDIAQSYSERMATERFYSHESPSGERFQDRYENAGYSCSVQINDSYQSNGAENIQYTYAFTDVETEDGVEEYESEEGLADALVEGWMNSEGHREIILQPYWENEGVGVYAIENPNGSGMKVYATQNFC